MTTGLVGANKLQQVDGVGCGLGLTDVVSSSDRGRGSRELGGEARVGLEGLACVETIVYVAKVGRKRRVDLVRVGLVDLIHLLKVDGAVALEKRLVGVRRLLGHASKAAHASTAGSLNHGSGSSNPAAPHFGQVFGERACSLTHLSTRSLPLREAKEESSVFCLIQRQSPRAFALELCFL